jgi:hypothetical protein
MQYRTHQNNNTDDNQLLNMTYMKLQQVKYNKLSKRPVETPLQQSVMIWNFLKKLEIERQQKTTEQWSTAAYADDKENQFMDIDHSPTIVIDKTTKTTTTTTTPIGSERRIKLLNKLENEQQEQQQKRCKSSSASYYSFYDYSDDLNQFEDDMSADGDYLLNRILTSNNTSNTNGNQFNLWSSPFSYLNKSCSYEHESSNSSNTQVNSNSNANIEQVINILIECE